MATLSEMPDGGLSSCQSTKRIKDSYMCNKKLKVLHCLKKNTKTWSLCQDLTPLRGEKSQNIAQVYNENLK